MVVVKPASFVAGRRISLGEPQVALTAPVLTKGVNHLKGGDWEPNTYYWVLTAVNDKGESLASDEVSATMIKTGAIDFSWEPVEGATGYKLYRGLTSGSPNKRAAILDDGTSYTDLGNTGTSAAPPETVTATGVITYEPGDQIPNETVKSIAHLGALLGNRSIIPDVDPHSRFNKAKTPSPMDLSPSMKDSL